MACTGSDLSSLSVREGDRLGICCLVQRPRGKSREGVFRSATFVHEGGESLGPPGQFPVAFCTSGCFRPRRARYRRGNGDASADAGYGAGAGRGRYGAVVPPPAVGAPGRARGTAAGAGRDGEAGAAGARATPATSATSTMVSKATCPASAPTCTAKRPRSEGMPPRTPVICLVFSC